MIRAYIGDFGHFFVIFSFITSLAASYLYFRSSSEKSPAANLKEFAKTFFLLHFVSIIGIVVCLFLIIKNHYYEYHYAWAHSSDNLPVEYMISCFWEGQEGSFLLWAFWHAVLGLFLFRKKGAMNTATMGTFMLIQAFLGSMILGLALGNLKIGSSPFILLSDAMPDAPIFRGNPNFIPKNGNGLNPLLQNYWMVIHPPVLFLGFAGVSIPFSYALAALIKKKYTNWVSVALPWSLFSAAVLGTGILMGAYWAYETLNFGGYWSWDPVENAVYVPWLILVAAIHGINIYRKKSEGLRTSFILIIGTFLLILYSTFLTRSGILGESSVHSFTDLGLSGQLLIWLSTFLLLSLSLFIFRRKHIPGSSWELSVYSSDFWLFSGIVVLCLAGFQVLVTTSIPVFNAVAKLFGGNPRMAPPAEQAAYYSNIQLWFSVAVLVLSALGQYFWWGKAKKNNVINSLSLPSMIAMLGAALIILLTDIREIRYIVLLTAGLFSIVANGTIVISVIKKKQFKLSGGALAHVGFGIMLVGILFSAGYSKIISLNRSGLLYSKEFPEDVNKENVLLFRNSPLKINGYELLYQGQFLKVEGVSDYIKKDILSGTEDPYKAVTIADIREGENVLYKAGDTVRIRPGNTYFGIVFKRENGTGFLLYPRAQVNPSMGLIASPAIKIMPGGDLYTHISSFPKPEEKNWSNETTYTLGIGDTLFINDYVGRLEKVELDENKLTGIAKDSAARIVKATIRVQDKNGEHVLQPKLLLEKEAGWAIPEFNEDIGVRMTFMHVHPEQAAYTFGVSTTQKDWIVLKIIEKPYIGLLWIGGVMMIFGFGIAFAKRKPKNKRNPSNVEKQLHPA